MKTFRFFTPIVIVILCMGLVSCNDDEKDEGEDTLQSLVGEWVRENDGGEEVSDGYIFYKDGTGIEWEIKSEERWEIKWSYSNNQLTITDEDGDKYTYQVKLKKGEIKDTMTLTEKDGEYTRTYKYCKYHDVADESNNDNIKGAWYSEREEEGWYFDGKGNGYFFDKYGDTENFTYKLSGTKLTIKENGGTYSVTVKISGNTLKITDEGENLTYTKVDINDFL
ncbi:hypothetical protein AB9N12_18400 [Bacteroides sp. AN502(2024)]|uniref:hypothetical protein n=1 Tax=Bacteroides sp. AN502(2024) TaxID=3160599 RepID=UPI003512A919